MTQKPFFLYRNYLASAVLGVFLIALGVTAISIPTQTTLDLSKLLGGVFILSGVFQLIHAFPFKQRRGMGINLSMAPMSILIGFFLILSPIVGALTITLSVAFYLLYVSLNRSTLAYIFRTTNGSRGLGVSAVISFCLGIYLLFTLATSSKFVPALFLGVDLIVFGLCLIALSIQVKMSQPLLTQEQALENFEDNWRDSA